MKFLVTIVFILISATAFADYLVVQRNGNLRQNESTSSEILEKLHTGDTLLLLELNQTAGYYHVVSLASRQEGWVYRTLVRKVVGEIEGEPLTGALETDAVVDIRVLDIGAGLCTLIKLPGNKYVIYDAGGDNYFQPERTPIQVKEYIPAGSVIELLVLSHTDADHIVSASQILRDYKVKKVLWTGYESSMIGGGNPTSSYTRLYNALENDPSIENINLNELDSTIDAGNHFSIGNAKFTFLCGFGSPPSEWGLSAKDEKLNSVSIVMKLNFGGNSVLFCGDAVGRHRNDPVDALIATEKFLVENAASLLQSTVIIAPHHGAMNGSSRSFVEHVKAESVIFAAGHKHDHPTLRTAEEYLRFTTANKIFRTDRGDDEGGNEWPLGRTAGCRDKYNDDTIQVQLRSNGTYRVYYMDPEVPCF